MYYFIFSPDAGVIISNCLADKKWKLSFFRLTAGVQLESVLKTCSLNESIPGTVCTPVRIITDAPFLLICH